MTLLKARKRNMTAKPIKLVCEDDDAPVDLSAASSVTFVISLLTTGFAAVVAPAIVDPDQAGAGKGKVSYKFSADDFTSMIPGTYKVEVVVVWPNTDEAIFPQGEWVRLPIIDHLPTALPPPTP